MMGVKTAEIAISAPMILKNIQENQHLIKLKLQLNTCLQNPKQKQIECDKMKHFAIKLQQIKKDIKFYTNYNLTSFNQSDLEEQVEEITNVWFVLQNYDRSRQKYIDALNNCTDMCNVSSKITFKKILYLNALCDIINDLLTEMKKMSQLNLIQTPLT